MTVDTSRGSVPVWRSTDSTESGRPLIFAMRGAFAASDLLEDLAVEGADLALVHLPAFHSPAIRPLSVATFAATYDEVVDQLFPRRDLLLLGLSTGALTALAMRSPTVRAQVLVEPFFSTAALWPLIEWLRADLTASPQELKAQWVEAIFGIAPDNLEDRDYSRLCSFRVPTWALIGDVPLMPRRPVPKLTSLTSLADRSRLLSAGAILRTARAGHDVPGEDRPALIDVLKEALAAL